MEEHCLVLAVFTGLVLLGGLAWVFWKKIIFPCVLRCGGEGGRWRCLTRDQYSRLEAGTPPPAPRASPSQHGYQGGASPTLSSSLSSLSLSSSSSQSTTRPSSLANYASFSSSMSSSSSGWTTPSPGATPVYIPPIPDSAKLSMSYPKPRHSPWADDADWTPPPRPVSASDNVSEAMVQPDDDTGSAAADVHDFNAIIDAINSLPSRLANIRPNYGTDDLRDHIAQT